MDNILREEISNFDETGNKEISCMRIAGLEQDLTIGDYLESIREKIGKRVQLISLEEISAQMARRSYSENNSEERLIYSW